jgi:hypothetical protein
MTALSRRTEQLIEHFIAPDARVGVRRRLAIECSAEALGCAGRAPNDMERIHFAVLKLGVKSGAALDRAILLARTDWRDLLMQAGFGEDLEAHNNWWQRSLP